MSNFFQVHNIKLKIMKKKDIIIIGIDVSKSTLDVFIFGYDYHFIVDNGPDGFISLLETIFKITKCRTEDLFFCFENTGKYSKMLSVFLYSQEITFLMESALRIKKSLGITRGKNDKVDSKRIAMYAYEKFDSLTPTVLPGEKLDKLNALLTLREKLIKHRTAYKNGISDLNDCYKDDETVIIRESQQRLIERITEEITLVENEIEIIINTDEAMHKNFKLIISVKGIGKINAFFFIAITHNFTLFSSARSYACYCGIAPFENSSGTIKGKTRIHYFANKTVKKLLNMAAVSVIKHKNEYRTYYEKRVFKRGKSKMSTINIIRNKLVYRVFAVVNRGTPYIDLHKYAA